jgi:hypothetical protein
VEKYVNDFIINAVTIVLKSSWQKIFFSVSSLKMNNWIYHLKDFANENGVSYAEAVKDPDCRKQYYDNLGKKVPKKVKKIVKIKPVEPVELLEPIKEKMTKIKKEIEIKTKPVKVSMKKNIVPDLNAF